MPTIDLRIVLGAIFFFASCAHERPVDTPRTADAVVAYRAVRAGEQPTTRADGLEFCAADGGVEAIRIATRTSDDWADKFEDHDLRQEVRSFMVRDPSLSQETIRVDVDKGEAILDGNVARDADAVAAARDALAVPGIIAVRLRTTSAEAPVQRTLVAVTCP